MRPQIQIQNDYAGFFENVVRDWVSAKEKNGEGFNNNTIIVNSGPYRPYAVTYEKRENGVLFLDFYSALRAGFGQLTFAEINELIDLL